MATEDCPSNTLQHETSVTERSPPLLHDALNGRPHFVEHNCSNIERRLEWFSRTLPTSASIECRDLWKQAAKAEQSFPVDATLAPLNVIKPQRRTNVQGAGIRTCSESSITGAASAQTTSELPSRAQKNLRRRNRLKPSADGSNFDTQRYSCVPMQVEYTHHPRVPLRTTATAVANSRDHEAGPVNAESHARMRGHPRTGSMQMNSVLQTQRRGENIDRSVVFRTTSNTPLCPSLCSDAAQEHQRCWRTGGSTPIHWVPWPSPDCHLCQNEGAGATEMWKSILRRNQGSDRLPGHPNGHIDSNGGSSEAGFRLSAVEAFEPRTRKPLLSVAQSSHPQCDTAKHAAPGPLAPGRLHCFVQGPVSQRYQSDSIHGRGQQQRVDTMMSHANIEHPYQASERMSMSGTGKRPYPEPGSAYLHSSTKSKDSNQGLSLCKYPGSSGLQHHLHVVQLLESETRRTTETAHASAGEGLAGKKKAEQKQHRTFILRSVLRRARALKPKATHLKVFLVNCGATTTVSRVQGGAVTGWSDPARRVAEMSERIAAPCTYSSELTTRGLPDDYESEDPLTFEDLGSSRNDMLRQWKDANLSLGECHRRRVSDLSFPAAFSVSPNHPCVVGEADGQRSGNEFSWVDHGSLENPNTLSFSSCPTEDQEGLVEVLSKEGQKQAIAAAKLLRPMRFTMIYCSDDAACQEMKNVILTVNRESPYVDDKRLGNRRKGDLAHLSNAEFMRRATKAGFTKETFRPPGGESLEDVRERVVRFFLEALVGEFLLSLNLRDFIAKAAMDQRRAITRTNCFTLTDVGSYCELLKVPPSVQTSILTSSKLLDVNGKRQRRRRRRRKRAHLTASLDAEEGNEDTCLCPRKISKGVADSSGLLMNSHDASAVSAERVTGNNVCLDERGYDGVVGQDEQEEFEFASVASCASVLYQSGLATDDEYASGGSAINTKINELPHEVEANDNGQGKTHPDEPDAEGNTTLRSEAFSSKIVEEILEDGQTATRCWTPLREAQEKSEETRNLGLIHLSATTAVQPLEITTEETGKYETTADVGKCSWMLAAPERRRGADEACYEALKSEAVAEPSLNAFRHSRVICHASGAEPDSSSSAKATKECVSLSLSTTNSANTVSNMQCIERSVVLPCVREEDCVSSSQGFSSLKSGHVLVASTLSDQQRIMFTRFLFFEEGQKILGSRCMLPEMGACQGNAGSSGMQFDNPAGDASPGERPQAGEHDVSVFTDLREVPERTLEKPVQDEIGSRRAAQMDSSPPVAGEFFDPECPIEPDGTSVNRESIEVSGKIPKTNTHLQREQVTSSSSEGFSRELENRSGDNDNGRLPVDDVKHKVIEAHATADEQSDYRKIVDRSKSGEKLMVGSFPQIVYDGEVTEDSGSRPGCCLEEFLHDVLVEYDSDVPPVRQRKEQTRPSGAEGDGGRCERMEQQGGLSLRDSHSLSQCSRRLQAESDCVAVSFPPSGCALLPSSTTSVDDVNELTAERGSCHSPYQNCQTMPISSPRRGKKLSEVNSGSLLPTWIAGGVCEGKTSCVSSSPVNNETCVARPDPGANDFTNWLSAKERTDHIYPVTDYCRDGPASGQDATEMCVKQFSETCQRRPFPASVKDRGDACGACQLPPELQTPFVLGDLVTSEPEAPSEPSMPHKCFDGYSIFSPALGRTRSTLLHVDGVDAMGGDASFYFRHASESCRDTRWTKPARGRIEQNHHSDCEEHYSSRIPLSRWRQPCGAKVVLPLIRNRFLLRPAHSAPSLRTCDKAIPWLQPPVASVKPREEPESQPKWHTTRLLRSRSLLDSKYSDRGTPRIPEVRASTSAVSECVCEREALTNHDRKERFKVHNPKQDEDAVSGTEPVVVQRRPPSTVRLSAYGAMPAAEGRKPRGAARRCRAALITNEARQHFDSMRQRQNSLNVTSESATREKNISCCSALKTQSGHNLRKDTARFVTDLVHSFAAALTECASAGFSPPSASLAHDCSSTGCGTNSNDSSSNIEESDGIGGTGSDGFSGTGSDSGWASTTYRGTAQTAKRSLSSLSRIERTCVGNSARHNDADVGFRTEQAKLCEGRHMGNACGGGAGACGRSTALEEPEDSMAVRGLNLRHWSGSWLGSLLARIGPSSRYNNTGAAESCGSSGTELVSLETEHEVRSPSEDADAHCKKAKEAVVKGMSGTGGARDNVWNDGHTRVSLRGYRVLLLMKRTVAQCVAASVASGLWLPSVSSLEAGFTKACPQTDQASTTGNSSVEDRDGDTTKSGCLAVLVITRECVIRELLQALCGRRFGNTIKAGSITVLDVYTRRTGNTELQRSLGRRRSEAWTWLTGRGSSVHQYLNDGRVQSIGAVGKGRGPHASTCCSLNRSLSDSYDASTASVQAEQRHVGGPEGFPCEWGNGEETSHTGTQAQEFDKSDGLKFDAKTTEGTVAESSSSLSRDQFSKCGHTESEAGTRVQACNGVPSSRRQVDCGESEARCSEDFMAVPRFSWECEHCSVNDDENVQKGGFKSDAPRRSQLHEDGIRHGKIGRSRTMSGTIGSQCSMKKTVGRRVYGSSLCGTCSAEHSLRGIEKSPRRVSEIDDEEVSVDLSDLKLLAAPYKSTRPFASEQRVEAVDALLSRVQCWVEVFNKKE
ncbi:phosphoglycerate mutase family protein [Toxoplasma gondii TgCatPRC2]|uniref:Phosphoglycerate mutase family protein n=1 Tax=Toxoplasma gondii TgCatPRC2 TaxID=1130821 RepID=A0A151HLJ4_TOXGO|nr:phosphoglycerate mutase family protein [Toxoplasma gondii TgCatPRC2]